jgi:NADP-dependent 3-hydroxy acid dehydrogenase YdfG
VSGADPATPALLGELFSLEGRVVVLTGASGAIGRALAAGLAGAGASVALLAGRSEPLEEVARALRSADEAAAWWAVDVLDAPALASVRERS